MQRTHSQFHFSDIYDAEKAKEEKARGEYNSQLRGDIPMLSDQDEAGTVKFENFKSQTGIRSNRACSIQ